MTTDTTLRSEAEFLRDCLTDLNERAGTRAFTEDEQREYDEGKSALAERTALLARHAEVAELSKLPGHVERGASFDAPNVIVRDNPFDLSELRTNDATQTRSQAMRAIEAGAFAKDAHRERAEELVRNLPTDAAVRVLATASPAYERAFGKIIQDPSGLSLDVSEREALSRAASLTSNAGGYAVPVIIDPTLILTSDGSANPFRRISRVVPITNGTWKGVSTAGVTAAFAAEASAITEGSPTLAQPTVTAHRAHAQINYSFEIGQDYPGFTSDMLMLLQDAKDQLEATKHAVGAGDGSTEPFGIVTALAGGSSEINVAGSEGVFAAVDLYAMEEALGPRFRPNASFVANKAIYNKVRQFDTAGGASLWERIGAGMPSQLLGYNAYEASAMDGAWDVAATANNYIAVLGDFQNYVIVDRIGMSVETVQHVVDGNGKLTGQRGLLAWWRTGADSVNDAAFTILDNPTTA